MSKRKQYPGKPDASVPRKERPRHIGLQWLPDSLIEKIIQYNRPEEKETEPFWKWLCQMRATCPAFRRVILSSINGSSPLTPTLLHLDDSLHPDDDDDEEYCERLVKLLDTIRIADWMGTHIQCVRAQVSTHSVANALLRLLCGPSPCFPKLTAVYISEKSISPVDYIDSHLFQLAKLHPRLTSLFLPETFVYGSMSPNTFASVALFLPNLKRFGVEGINNYEKRNHSVAFLSKAGPKLTAASFSFIHWRGDFYERIASHCQNLDTLILKSCFLTIPLLTTFLQSAPNLVHLELYSSLTRFSDQGLLDAIIENKPKLKTFRTRWCNFIDDDGLIRLFDRQIQIGGGRMSLTTLGISEHVSGPKRVTLAGLRNVLNKWRDTDPILPLSVEILTGGILDAQFDPLIDEFPDVTFKKMWFKQSFD